MNPPQDESLWALPMAGLGVTILLVVAILIVCLRVYGRLALRVVRGDGKVSTQSLGLPDLLVVGVLALWAVFIGIASFLHAPAETPPVPLTDEAVGKSILLFGIIVGGIVFFLQQRNISVVRLFGFRAVPLLRALGIGALLFAAAFPLVRITTALTLKWLGEDAEIQPIVQLFSDAASQGDWSRLVAPIFLAVVAAPLTEEFIFRGYLYGVVRRYLGPITAILLTSALFAVIHFNLLSLPSLFILAICFALAYETTGSLLVPMAMHAIFNAVNLAELFLTVSRQ